MCTVLVQEKMNNARVGAREMNNAMQRQCMIYLSWCKTEERATENEKQTRKQVQERMREREKKVQERMRREKKVQERMSEREEAPVHYSFSLGARENDTNNALALLLPPPRLPSPQPLLLPFTSSYAVSQALPLKQSLTRFCPISNHARAHTRIRAEKRGARESCCKAGEEQP